MDGKLDGSLGSYYPNSQVFAAQGSASVNAQNNKDALEQRMTREQIAEAQRLSREWIEAHLPGGN